MRTINTLMAFVALAIGASGVQAANYASGQPLLCAVQSVSECGAGVSCEQLMPFAVNMPDFFLIDAANSVYGDVIRAATTIKGADDGIDGVRDGVAWTVAIEEETGAMIITASGHGFGLVAFGACTFR